ncbi:hypothetical protein Pint_05023 [Pistacia integerrima]|uniref:Uncharacterized protein n=1 Tax=Pistacia integerrima TaxID=434235 RepID=A0ACC0Z2W7_9ROSI|nr:hypothetical protein Pint_05023 [Pistacia integerrima]
MGFKFHYNQVLCLLFLFLYADFEVNPTVICNPKESLALLQFNNTNAFNLTVSTYPKEVCTPQTLSWVEGTDCCFWKGVTCDNVTGNVIGLDLSSSCLSGTILDNNTLFQLSHLQWHNLDYNFFEVSPMSSVFGLLRDLTHLNLSTSGFSGLVPSEISHLSKLVSLDLSDNLQSRSLRFEPQNFALLVQNLTKLSVFCLTGVDMSLVSPVLLSNLSSSISTLSLDDTTMHGKTPANVFRLPNLHILRLSYNSDLTGFFPQSNWSSPLRLLDLSYTSFKGQIPHSIGNLKFLEGIFLSNCSFTGPIPASFGNLTQLTALCLDENALTGQVPSSISKLEQLTHIQLSWNSLAGQIPNFGNLSKLTFLSLSRNNFSGPLPYHVSRLPYLTDIDLSHNFLSGKVPPELFSLPSLESLVLSDNTFSAPIDQFEPSNSLSDVDLSNNKISGLIPSSMFKLEKLTSLDLSSNNFSGTLQLDILLQPTYLQQISLSYNSLLSLSSNNRVKNTSSILKSFEMSSCNISEFPSNLRTLENLLYLDLSNNNICGRILKSE